VGVGHVWGRNVYRGLMGKNRLVKKTLYNIKMDFERTCSKVVRLIFLAQDTDKW
jgi:hypothetical protein